ncbi:hypothetical protein ONA70_34240, partial [Micromonospora yasonensis]|nr:hypothetical protein [Micromonospora yasonensis]
ADEATTLGVQSGLVTPPDPRGAAVARFAANARRLRTGEITPAEFDELMATDDEDRRHDELPHPPAGAAGASS